ncbi:sensor histidine kinase KdpD [Rossellomorea aquimaris]|jgi:signal transduction histidine kinase|uniref:histidine kinase n=1 Tax=Rossellomorea aquimaris TaxID=189382 RepID=A0A5D4U335_9BACI|nr:HAMP domain-containing sensor histidine kinase [Rossellomorea aquimaris]TYS81610.1 HAMP domain-containing histidine kinase [Rossellomorea aquimaris]TYS88234.1 HAMP domain-containing histidine kinase [Rossellomorea aquimaris]
MWRNREVQWFFISLLCISVGASVLAGFLFSIRVALFVLVTSVLLAGCSFIFTRWRYREIEKLSGYLRKISSGDDSLDVRDNQEGELSILKNDIYKVTLMLSEHRSFLEKDKLTLTNALSDISHQLKTPLTSMMVMADLLSDSTLEESKRAEFTQHIRVQLERIEWLVSSLLKLSKIDAGTISFKKDNVVVRDLIQSVVQPVLIPMDIKEQTLSVSGDESVSFTGDLRWTAEALINILKNAVEHTGEGGVISLSFSENPLYTEITIADNGDGIPKEDLPYIFRRFYKGKNASDDSVGIGLAMAYSIITSQQGDLEVRSEKGNGTVFSIKFYK